MDGMLILCGLSRQQILRCTIPDGIVDGGAFYGRPAAAYTPRMQWHSG